MLGCEKNTDKEKLHFNTVFPTPALTPWKPVPLAKLHSFRLHLERKENICV